MSIENMIHQIVELDKKINSDIDMVCMLESDGLGISGIDLVDNRISENINLQDKLKMKLAELIVKSYTGYDLKSEEVQSYAL